MPGKNVDGMDVLAVHEAAKEMVERARRGDGPSFLVATTYRMLGHHVGDPLNYRDRAEVEEWGQKDAIVRFRKHLVESGVLSEAEADQLEKEVEASVNEAAEFAKSSPEPAADILMEDIYA
jgi:pyruvate dehydrogenase E1 component alpha subunit